MHSSMLPGIHSVVYVERSSVAVLPAHVVFSAYFVITEPPYAREWRNGQANLVTWVKGVMDGIDNFDVEISRLSEDGLTFVARNGE